MILIRLSKSDFLTIRAANAEIWRKISDFFLNLFTCNTLISNELFEKYKNENH